jgi:hypothetical protein
MLDPLTAMPAAIAAEKLENLRLALPQADHQVGRWRHLGPDGDRTAPELELAAGRNGLGKKDRNFVFPSRWAAKTVGTVGL